MDGGSGAKRRKIIAKRNHDERPIVIGAINKFIFKTTVN
jgi:hypothetical protein